jgi:hypothetical protein
VPSQSVAAADPRGRGSQALADESNASKSSWLRRSRSRISRRSGEGRNRTGDTTVFSRVLYQLSYPASRIAPTALAITGETRFPPWAPRQGPQEQRGRPSRPLESETRATRAEAISGEGRNRTGDTTVFSRVLYQLSYLAERKTSLAAPRPTLSRKEAAVPKPKPGFARREAKCVRARTTKKKGARGGNMVSPAIKRTSGPVLPRRERPCWRKPYAAVRFRASRAVPLPAEISAKSVKPRRPSCSRRVSGGT